MLLSKYNNYYLERVVSRFFSFHFGPKKALAWPDSFHLVPKNSFWGLLAFHLVIFRGYCFNLLQLSNISVLIC